MMRLKRFTGNPRPLSKRLLLGVVILFFSVSVADAQQCTPPPQNKDECLDDAFQNWEDAYDNCSSAFTGNKSAQVECYKRVWDEYLAAQKDCNTLG